MQDLPHRYTVTAAARPDGDVVLDANRFLSGHRCGQACPEGGIRRQWEKLHRPPLAGFSLLVF